MIITYPVTGWFEIIQFPFFNIDQVTADNKKGTEKINFRGKPTFNKK